LESHKNLAKTRSARPRTELAVGHTQVGDAFVDHIVENVTATLNEKDKESVHYASKVYDLRPSVAGILTNSCRAISGKFPLDVECQQRSAKEFEK
jgi:hypothetical protein